MLATILGRRSIRRYTGETVADSDLHDLLRAAMAAPSAGNEQPWHFIIITERRLLDAISDIHPHAGMVSEAPVAILVCGEPALEKYPGLWVQDLAAAIENLLLAAHGKGLGAVWCAIYPDSARMAAFRTLLGIPEKIFPFALIPIGHPAEQKGPAERYKPERVHENGWGK
jgi:nitroreductase